MGHATTDSVAAAAAASLAVFLGACASSGVHTEVVDREVEWATAMRANDLDALEQIMAPDFRLTGKEIPPFAMTIDNGNPGPGLAGWRWRRNLSGMSFGTIEMANVETFEIADDLIAVNMRMYLDEWSAAGPGGAQDLSGSYDLTDIWVNRDGAWRVQSRYTRPVGRTAARPVPEHVIGDE